MAGFKSLRQLYIASWLSDGEARYSDDEEASAEDVQRDSEDAISSFFHKVATACKNLATVYLSWGQVENSYHGTVVRSWKVEGELSEQVVEVVVENAELRFRDMY